MLLAMVGATITTPVSHAGESAVADVTVSEITNTMCPVTTDVRRSRDHRGHGLALYRTALFIGAIAVGANAFFGSALVYGIGHYAW